MAEIVWESEVPSHTDMLPPGLEYGWVYHRVIRAIGATNNDGDDLPDGAPPQGTVVFVPDHHTTNVIPDEGDATTVLNERITCRIHQGVNEINDPDYPRPIDPAALPAWEAIMHQRAGEIIDPAGNVGGVHLPVGVWTAYYNLVNTRALVDPVYFILTEFDTKDAPLDLAKIEGIKPLPNGDLAWHGSVPPPQDMLWLYVDPTYDPDSGDPLPTYTAPNGTIEHGELIEWEA